MPRQAVATGSIITFLALSFSCCRLPRRPKSLPIAVFNSENRCCRSVMTCLLNSPLSPCLSCTCGTTMMQYKLVGRTIRPCCVLPSTGAVCFLVDFACLARFAGAQHGIEYSATCSPALRLLSLGFSCVPWSGHALTNPSSWQCTCQKEMISSRTLLITSLEEWSEVNSPLHTSSKLTSTNVDC